MKRTHLVPTGTMPQTQRTREIKLATSTRHIAPNNRGAVRSSMGSLCDSFALYGVNANPRRHGTTSGEGIVISRRFKLA